MMMIILNLKTVTVFLETEWESFKADMLKLYNEYEQFFKYIEPFTVSSRAANVH